MLTLSIHVTDLCNSECDFCVVASPFYTRDSVEYRDILRFLLENARRGYEVVNLHGGEPTIHPKFRELLSVIRNLGYPEIHIQTNAVKLKDPELVTYCAANSVTKFIISLHGSMAEVHDRQTRTRNGFERTVVGIQNAVAIGIHVRTNTVITLENLHDLPEIAALAVRLGVNHLNFSNLHPVGSARLSRVRMMAALSDILQPLCQAVEIGLQNNCTVTIEGFPHCFGIGTSLADLHLQNEYRDIKLMIRGQILDNYDDFMRGDMRAFGPPCVECDLRSICGGVYPEYIEFFGWDEMQTQRAVPSKRSVDMVASH